MKKQTKTTPSVVPTPTPAAVAASGFMIGRDRGARSHYGCVLDAAGQILHEGPLPNDRVARTWLLTQYPAASFLASCRTSSWSPPMIP